MAAGGCPLMGATIAESNTLSPRRGHAQFVLSKIEGAVVRPRPFPYLVVNDILPETVYGALIPQWPADELFRTTNYKRRRQLYLNRTLAALPAEAAAVWRDVLDLAGVVNRALFRKF